MILKNKFLFYCFFFLLILSNNSYCSENNNEWHQLIKNNIYVMCKEKDINNGKRIIDFAHKKFSKISSDLGFTPNKKIQIIIASSKKDLYQITGSNLPEWSSGAAIPSKSIILLKSPRITNPDIDIEQIIVHELTHIGLYMATGGQDLMKWFDEGFAQYYSGALNMNSKILMAKRLMRDDFLSLKEIDEVLTFQKTEAALAYEEAHAAVLYLIEVGGIEAVKVLIENLNRTGSMDQAMKTAIGIGFEEFESEWITAMKRRYQWLVFFDYRLIISVVLILLFLSAYLVKMKRVKKIKQKWENENIENFETNKENSLD